MSALVVEEVKLTVPSSSDRLLLFDLCSSPSSAIVVGLLRCVRMKVEEKMDLQVQLKSARLKTAYFCKGVFNTLARLMSECEFDRPNI